MRRLIIALLVAGLALGAVVLYRNWTYNPWDVTPGSYMLDSGDVPQDVALWLERIEQSGEPGYYIGRSRQDDGSEFFYIHSTFYYGNLHMQPDSEKQTYHLELSQISDEDPTSIVFLRSSDGDLMSVSLETPYASTIILAAEVPDISNAALAPILDLQEELPSTPVAFERRFTPAAEGTLPGPGVTVSKYAETYAAYDNPDTLVVAERGECPSNEYGIRVTKILRNNNGLHAVYVRLLDPEPLKPGTAQEVVLTRPVDAVKIAGWQDDWRFRLVVERTEVGPFTPEEVSFTPYDLGTYSPEDALQKPLANELGVGVLPLVSETDGANSALIVHREQCPTTGYGIEVTRITRDIVSGQLCVYVKLTDPAPGSQQDQVITRPVDVVRIDGLRHEWVYRVIVE